MSQDKEFKLLRIMKGRLNFRRGDLSLFILEPNQNLMLESVEIYEEAFKQAYFNGVYLQQEINDYNLEQGNWTPFDDKILEDLKKEVEDNKVNAFKSFYNKRALFGIKSKIRSIEYEIAKLSIKKSQYDKYTCENAANYARWNWIIENSTYYKSTNKLYDWKHVNLTDLVSYYEDNSISSVDIRELARFDTWRSIWSVGKKTGNIFNECSSNYTKDQLALCGYSIMYDNVYESPEHPDEEIIEDDDCLDGWFIEQRRKSEKSRTEREVESKITNSKISNSNEIFVLASSEKEAERINLVNPPHIEQIKKQRMAVVQEKGNVTDKDFIDVKMEMDMQATKAFINKM